VVATAGRTHPCDPPPLCLICIVEQAVGVSEHLGGKLRGQVLHWQTVVGVGTKDLRRLVHERRMGHGRHLEATHMVIHGDVGAQYFLVCWVLDGSGLLAWDLSGSVSGSGAEARNGKRLFCAGQGQDQDQEGCVWVVPAGDSKLRNVERSGPRYVARNHSLGRVVG
jgi:hypothetical protein